MRQAKPDDVFSFLTLEEIRELWPRLDRHLATSRPFWEWALSMWAEAVRGLGGRRGRDPLSDLRAVRADRGRYVIRDRRSDDPVVTKHELLVDKLVTLLERSELRDLADVEQLLATGGDLERALRDASRKDGGFSILTLAWTLRSMNVPQIAATVEWDAARTGELTRFRDLLVTRLMALADPRS